MNIEKIRNTFINLLISFLMLITTPCWHVNAESTTITCTYIPGRQIYYVDGIKYDTPESHFLHADGIPAYCIQPKIPDIFNPIGYYSEDPGWDKISDIDRNIMLAYAYFGYGYAGDRSNERYLAAQDLIWEHLGTTNITRATIDTTNKKNEILSLVAQLRKTPNIQMMEYNGAVKEGNFYHAEVDGNQPIHIVDTNNSLDNYTVIIENGSMVDQYGNLSSYKTSSDFYVKVAMGQTAKIRFVNLTLDKNPVGGVNQIIYRSPINQDVIKAGQLHVNSAEVSLSAIGTSISINKHDIDTGKLTPQGEAETFEGASYELFDETQKQSIGMLNIQQDGTSNTIRGLHYHHQYSLKEVTSPLGYHLDTTKIMCDFNLLSKNENTLHVDVNDDVITGKFKIHKLFADRQHSALAENEEGAEFLAILQKHINRYGSFEEASNHLYEFTEKEYAFLTTDQDGNAESRPLAYGKYIVRQTNAKDSEIELLKEDFIFEVNQENQPIVKYEISNLPKEYYLRLVKKDAETNQIIDYHSAGFKIKDEMGNYVSQRVGDQVYDTFQTSSKLDTQYPKGTFCISDQLGTITTPLKLAPGKYTLEEVVNPDGFVRIQQEIPFELKQTNVVSVDELDNQYITVEVVNERIYGRLQLKKNVEDYECDTSLVDKNNLSGIEFELVSLEDIIEPIHGTVELPANTVFSKITTDEEGNAQLDHIPLGRYYLQEVHTLDGLILDHTQYLLEFISQDDTVTPVIQKLGLTNPITKTEITKVMIGGNSEVTGAKLVISDAQGNQIDEWISTNNIAHKIAGLHPTKAYTLHEEMTVDGYYYSEDIQFTVNADGSVQQVEMKDKPVQYLIEKVDDENQFVEGAHLQLKNLTADQIVPLPNDGITQDEPMLLNGLLADNEYELEELEHVEGVHLAASIQFTVPKYNPSSSDPMIIKMVDLQVEIGIEKIDDEGKPVENAELEIYQLDEDTQQQTLIHEFTTDNTGIYNVSAYLKGGSTYILHEKKAPFGYEKMEDIIFTAKGTKQHPQIIQGIDRKKKIYLQVKKVDAEDHTIALENTEFTVYHQDGSVAKDIFGNDLRGYTNQNGMMDFVVPYAAEIFYVLETNAPVGYEISYDKYELKHLVENNFKQETPTHLTVADYKEKDIPTGVGLHYGIMIACLIGIFGFVWVIFKPRKTKHHE
ncbi:MAG: SpaA isopeptide-forming pilin-related protein [Bulleidia sp.]|nr:SpaA isopeptide-forming pilin-related protein [Bulleidia sp.]